MKIAIVGSGISGLTAAHLLHPHHEIHLFEADSRLGGHTHTHQISIGEKSWPVDTGFIVCNDWTYPNFQALMKSVGVELRPSEMTFSVQSAITGIEWAGLNVDTLFCQRRNFLRPSFLLMVREIFRFNKEAKALAKEESEGDIPLGTWLTKNGYSAFFANHYVYPMGGAIWSTSPEKMRTFPAKFFAQFFENHGMLNVSDRPTWRTVVGGSAGYIPALTRGWEDRIRLNSPVTKIVRPEAGGVLVSVKDQEAEYFDEVILACHSDQALRMLQDPSPEETAILSAIPYQPNEAILHTDTSIMPKARKAWSAWNFHLLGDGKDADRVSVTYWMNCLQGLDAPEQFLVTLNHDDGIDPAKIIKRISYSHPFFTPEGAVAQKRKAEIQGKRHTWFAGAWWTWGFHEDGCKSGLEVAKALGGVGL